MFTTVSAHLDVCRALHDLSATAETCMAFPLHQKYYELSATVTIRWQHCILKSALLQDGLVGVCSRGVGSNL